MKERISVTLDNDTLSILDSLLEDVQFRNRSHLIECLIKKYKEENKKDGETGKNK